MAVRGGREGGTEHGGRQAEKAAANILLLRDPRSVVCHEMKNIYHCIRNTGVDSVLSIPHVLLRFSSR